MLRNHFLYKFLESVEKSLGHSHLRPKQSPQFSPNFHIFVKIETSVMAWNGCVPEFFSTDSENSYKNWFLDTLINSLLLWGLGFYSICFLSCRKSSATSSSYFSSSSFFFSFFQFFRVSFLGIDLKFQSFFIQWKLKIVLISARIKQIFWAVI